MDTTGFLRTTGAAVALSVAFFGSREAAEARVAAAPAPYQHKFSCYDFAWQSQDLKNCLAHRVPAPGNEGTTAAVSQAEAKPKPIVAVASYHHIFSCYDFAWQSQDLKTCLAQPPQKAAQDIVENKPAISPVAKAPTVTHEQVRAHADSAPRHAAAPVIVQSRPHVERQAAAKPHSIAPPPPPAPAPKPTVAAAPAPAKHLAHRAAPAKAVVATKAERPSPRQLVLPLPPVANAPVAAKAEKGMPRPAIAHEEAAAKQPRAAATTAAKPLAHRAAPTELQLAKPAEPTRSAPTQHAAKTLPPPKVVATKPPVPARAASARSEPRHPVASNPSVAAVKKGPAATIAGPSVPKTTKAAPVDEASRAPILAAPRTPVTAGPLSPTAASPALPQILRGEAPQDTASVPADAPKPSLAKPSTDAVMPASDATPVLPTEDSEQGPSGHVTIEKTPDGVRVIRGQVDHGN